MNTLREEQTRPRVLVVDDDLVNRMLVVKGLASLRCGEIFEAEDGLAAKELLTQHPFAVVITDVMMPRMDGLALMRWAKEHCPGPVWIILSGLDTFDAAVEAIQLGAFDFLAKPSNLKEVEVSVRNAIDHRQLLEDKENLHRHLEERVSQLERLCWILEDQALQIEQDLRRAEVIQSALLPKAPPRLSGFSVSALYRPGRCVGGDLYDFVEVDDRYVVFYVADASGHGVSAAMLSVLFKQRLHVVDNESGNLVSPGSALTTVNRELHADVAAPGMFVTATYCVLDTRRGELTIASAGHPPTLIVRASGETCWLERTGPALGLYSSAHFEERRLSLDPGDRLLLYTDGLLEQDTQASLVEDEIVKALQRKEIRAPEVLRRLFRSAAVPLNDDRDDITMVLLECRAGSSTFDNASSASEGQADELPSQPAEALLCGETGDSTYIRVHGRGTHRQSDAFYEAVRSVLEARRLLTLDLSVCEYLDSTFLGTIHEVVDQADAAGVGVRLRGVQESVRRLFRELSMDLVLRHIQDDGEPLPHEWRPLARSNGQSRRKHLKILRAHEVLASLSEENRRKFKDVVESLRGELSGP